MRISGVSIGAVVMLAASLAGAVGPQTFIVANDEDNVLRVYGPADVRPQPGAFDLSAFLGVAADGPEADIEGATVRPRRRAQCAL